MIHKAKALSPDQRPALKSLLGESIREDEEIIVRTAKTSAAPEWPKGSWEQLKIKGWTVSGTN